MRAWMRTPAREDSQLSERGSCQSKYQKALEAIAARLMVKSSCAREVWVLGMLMLAENGLEQEATIDGSPTSMQATEAGSLDVQN